MVSWRFKIIIWVASILTRKSTWTNAAWRPIIVINCTKDETEKYHSLCQQHKARLQDSPHPSQTSSFFSLSLRRKEFLCTHSPTWTESERWRTRRLNLLISDSMTIRKYRLFEKRKTSSDVLITVNIKHTFKIFATNTVSHVHVIPKYLTHPFWIRFIHFSVASFHLCYCFRAQSRPFDVNFEGIFGIRSIHGEADPVKHLLVGFRVQQKTFWRLIATTALVTEAAELSWFAEDVHKSKARALVPTSPRSARRIHQTFHAFRFIFTLWARVWHTKTVERWNFQQKCFYSSIWIANV